MTSVAILDYGIGNLLSIVRAIDAAGGSARLVTTPEETLTADRLVVPGVGAFGRCSHVLRERGLSEAIVEYVRLERPLLGICVGMQLMLEHSTEFGKHDGFSLIPGTVDPIPSEGIAGPHKIPHIGWNGLVQPRGAPNWDDGFLSGIPEGAQVYFVHSFSARPREARHVVATTDYNGCSITAVIAQDQMWGVQFHPEKSGAIGLKILTNFVAL